MTVQKSLIERLKKEKNDAENAHFDEKNRLSTDISRLKGKFEHGKKDNIELHQKKERYKTDAIRLGNELKLRDKEIQVK